MFFFQQQSLFKRIFVNTMLVVLHLRAATQAAGVDRLALLSALNEGLFHSVCLSLCFFHLCFL